MNLRESLLPRSRRRAAFVREEKEEDPEDWYRLRGQRYRARVGGRGLREQCVEAVKRDVSRHLAHLPDLPADLRELLLAAFIQARVLDSRLLQLCIQNGLYSLDLSKATRFEKDSVSAVLSSCPHIHTLNLTSCLYLGTDAIVRLMRGLPELTTLILDDIDFEVAGLRSIIDNATQLRNLSLRGCTLPCPQRNACTVDPNLVDAFVNLKLLTQSINSFVEAAAENLQCLDLSYLNVVGGDLKLASASRLAALYLAGYEFNGDPKKPQETLLALGSHLNYLSLSDCAPFIDDACLYQVAESLPNLIELHLGNHKTLTPGTLRRFGQCCPRLAVLYLRHCESLQPSGFQDDNNKDTPVFRELRELDIIECYHLNYDLRYPRRPNTWMASCLPSLERLGISWNEDERQEATRIAPSLGHVTMFGQSD